MTLQLFIIIRSTANVSPRFISLPRTLISVSMRAEVYFNFGYIYVMLPLQDGTFPSMLKHLVRKK